MRNANWYFLIEKYHMKRVHLSTHMNLYHEHVLWQHFERKSTLTHSNRENVCDYFQSYNERFSRFKNNKTHNVGYNIPVSKETVFCAEENHQFQCWYTAFVDVIISLSVR